jgi:hypothetical protein
VGVGEAPWLGEAVTVAVGVAVALGPAVGVAGELALGAAEGPDGLDDERTQSAGPEPVQPAAMRPLNKSPAASSVEPPCLESILSLLRIVW